MTVSLSAIPLDIRVPGQYLEIDASKAVPGTPAAPQKILLIGQRIAGGTVPALVPTRIVSAAQAAQAFGRGSMLAQMAAALKTANDSTESWAIALDNPAGGVFAAQNVTVTGPATAAGTLALYVAGTLVPVAVAAGDSVGLIVQSILAAVNAQPDLPLYGNFTTPLPGGAASATLTARHQGLTGNDIDVRVNYYQNDALPAGVGVTIATATAGSGAPDLSQVWATIGDSRYSTIVTPYTDAGALTSIETELASRWGPMRQIEGLGVAATRQSMAQAAALGNSRNSAFVTILPMRGALTPSWSIAAAYAGTLALFGGIDPARPFQTLPLPGVLPPAAADRFTRQERELLLHDSMSTFTVSGGTVLLERPITTFATDGYGLPSVAFLDVNTPLTLAYLRQTLRARIAAKFPRMKLADDRTSFGVGQAIVTPSIIRAEVIALARDWEDQGLVEDVDDFKAQIVVERDATDRNRVNALIPPNIVNQFRVFAGAIQFLL